MISDLPEDLQQKVMDLLQLGKFPDAKHVHDEWQNSESV